MRSKRGSPFFDQELWNFAQSLPYSVRLHNGSLKAILRVLAARHLGPRVAQGRKRGFGIPVNRLLAGKWKRPLLEVLSTSHLQDKGSVNAQAAANCLAREAAVGYAPNQLWHIYVLESWLRHDAVVNRESAGALSLA